MSDNELNSTGLHAPASVDESEPPSILDLMLPLLRHWKLLCFGSLAVGIVALGITFAITPTFTARTSFLPPQQQQSNAMAALASLGGLAGLAGSAAGLKSPADQLVALMQSVTVEDRLIEQFDLMKVYKTEFKSDTRMLLEKYTRIAIGKKDGLISIEVDDHSPKRAADMANQYVAELRRMTGVLTVTEAQQRRAFYDAELGKARAGLAKAQATLQASGFSSSALRVEPKAAAEGYARLKAEATAAEVRLQTLRSSLVDNTPEVQRQMAALTALREQLTRLERTQDSGADADYLGKYREFKYQEALFELFARQYESARLDESREGPLIQVVDTALPPEVKSKPRRGSTAVIVTLIAFAMLSIFVVKRDAWRRAMKDPGTARKVDRLRAVIAGRPTDR